MPRFPALLSACLPWQVLAGTEPERRGAAGPVAAGNETMSMKGYVVDIYCWDLPNHVALDGANLETSPGDHILHCMQPSRVPQCKTKGYTLMEEYMDGNNNKKYRPRYLFDKPGNEHTIRFVDKEVEVNGDRKFDVQVEVTGTVAEASENEELRPGLGAPEGDEQIFKVTSMQSVCDGNMKSVTCGPEANCTVEDCSAEGAALSSAPLVGMLIALFVHSGIAFA